MTQRLGEECWWCIRLKEGTNDWRRGRLLAWSLDTADLDAPGHSGTHPVGIVEDLATGTVHSLPVDLIRFCEDQPEEEKMAEEAESVMKSLFDSGVCDEAEKEMYEEAESVVKSYVESGVFAFGELIAKIQQDLGGELPIVARAAFAKAWDKLKSQGDIPAMGVDRSNFAAITRFARQIQHALVESGITETEKVVDAVHESLVEILPGITRREASHHMIGLYLPYLPYTPPSEDPFTEEMKVAGSEEECLAKMREEFAVRRLRQIEEKRMAEEAESRKKPKK